VSGQGIGQVVLYVVVLIALAYPLGLYMARVFGSLKAPRVLSTIEGGFYRLARTDPRREQDGRYTGSPSSSSA
jgi:potassium-transporting ATPase potassium-binding subunit